MKNIKCRATLSYDYDLGDIVVHNVTNSNFVQPELREINIRVRKYANVNYFKPGDIITYTVVITNDGTYPAQDVCLKEPLKHQSLLKETIKVRSLVEPTLTYTENKDEVIFTLDYLEPQYTIYVTYQARVEEIIDINFNIDATAIVQADNYTLSTNTVMLIQKYAKIICEKKTDSIIYPNKQFAIEIALENIGNEKAVNLDFSDQLPERFCLDEVYLGSELLTDYVIEGNTLKLSIGEIAPFTREVITLIGMIKRN